MGIEIKEYVKKLKKLKQLKKLKIDNVKHQIQSSIPESFQDFIVFQSKLHRFPNIIE